MIAPEIVTQLVERFERNIDDYRSGKYNETQVRIEFVDPLFKALGWDVDNEQGHAERYKDVIHEDAIKMGGSTKAPDYSFRIGGSRKFFVEAKKPSINLKDDTAPAFQVRRYAWSAKLPISILTDFEEFAVYDCRGKPQKTDSAPTARIDYLTYKDYADKWEDIHAKFSKDAVLKGDFDRFVEGFKTTRGTMEVDAAFLAEIERWRELLARNIAIRNQALSQRELNFAVQRTIDRLIFLRISEDRGIEPYGRLNDLAQGENVYVELCKLFRRADDRYNSGLFHFKDEHGRTGSPDHITLGLSIDDKTIKDILKNLYYPDSPYEFSVLPADILGQVYEQFLGKVIRLTEGHRAKVEEKPEVKKAGGVYYTPTYIVDYIVENAVGKLVEDKTPRQINKLRILDPACGSGSFLLGAYQYLLDWHLAYYLTSEVKAHKRRIYQVGEEDWRLTIEERKQILLNNIYGVDIDTQAVEVTKLSLLLKVLEGENQEQLAMFQERVLPDLGNNIKCGNSLIGPDFYEGQQVNMFEMDAEERMRINAFDWEVEFAEIMQAGGFDAVIGNPPYIRIQAMKEWAPLEVEFYKKRFKAASKGNYDIYVVFVEKGLSLLNKNGKLGFILPHKFFNAKYGEPLRGLIAAGKHLSEIVHFGDQQVFRGATTYSSLLFLNKNEQYKFHFKKVGSIDEWRINNTGSEDFIDSTKVTANNWIFIIGKEVDLFEKLSQHSTKLEKIAHRIFQGFKTGADNVFIVEVLDENLYFSKALDKELKLEEVYLRSLYKSGEMKRYNLKENKRAVIFPYLEGNLIPWKEINQKAPRTAEYLDACKDILGKREKGRFLGPNWYCYSRKQALQVISQKKILTADLNPYASYCIDGVGNATFPGGAAGGYGILVEDDLFLYILALLNSKCVDFYLKKITTNFRGGWFGYSAKNIRQLPIRTIDFDDPGDKIQHDNIVSLVEAMLSLHKQLAAAATPHEQTALQRQIDTTDEQIDQIVYQLYDLTEEEIKIVEESVGE